MPKVRHFAVAPTDPDRSASHQVRDQVSSCFLDDAPRIASIDAVGPETIVFETDCPHADSTWPDCQQVAVQVTKVLDAVTGEKVLVETQSVCWGST